MQGKYAQAEALYEQSQAMLEKIFGEEHRHVVIPLISRASLLDSQVGSVRQRDFKVAWKAFSRTGCSSGPRRTVGCGDN